MLVLRDEGVGLAPLLQTYPHALDPLRLRNLVMQLLQLLVGAFRELGFTHCDLHSGNIVLGVPTAAGPGVMPTSAEPHALPCCADGVVRLLDFGTSDAVALGAPAAPGPGRGPGRRPAGRPGAARQRFVFDVRCVGVVLYNATARYAGPRRFEKDPDGLFAHLFTDGAAPAAPGRAVPPRLEKYRTALACPVDPVADAAVDFLWGLLDPETALDGPDALARAAALLQHPFLAEPLGPHGHGGPPLVVHYEAMLRQDLDSSRESLSTSFFAEQCADVEQEEEAARRALADAEAAVRASVQGGAEGGPARPPPPSGAVGAPAGLGAPLAVLVDCSPAPAAPQCRSAGAEPCPASGSSVLQDLSGSPGSASAYTSSPTCPASPLGLAGKRCQPSCDWSPPIRRVKRHRTAPPPPPRRSPAQSSLGHLADTGAQQDWEWPASGDAEGPERTLQSVTPADMGETMAQQGLEAEKVVRGVEGGLQEAEDGTTGTEQGLPPIEETGLPWGEEQIPEAGEGVPGIEERILEVEEETPRAETQVGIPEAEGLPGLLPTHPVNLSVCSEPSFLTSSLPVDSRTQNRLWKRFRKALRVLDMNVQLGQPGKLHGQDAEVCRCSCGWTLWQWQGQGCLRWQQQRWPW